jgi:hypothetical protein
MMDAISHIVNKIITKETTYVLKLFVDFSDGFNRIGHSFSFQGASKYRFMSTEASCFDLTSKIERSRVLMRTPECVARKKINRDCP